ncbi:MAG: phosphatidate cytidylyltransferase [Thermoguttaceae bacterium]
MDVRTVGLIGSVMLLLVGVTMVAGVLRRHRGYGADPAIIDTVRSRVVAWWLLFGALIGAFLIERSAAVVLFGLISFWALREYITLTPTRPADHSTLFWVFFLWTPLQFALVGIDRVWFASVTGVEPYTVFSILIPTYAFLIVPAGIAVSGDSKHFLDRIAKIQVGLLICVYSLSFAPAILTMELPQPSVAEEMVTSPMMGHVIETTVDAARPLIVPLPLPEPLPEPHPKPIPTASPDAAPPTPLPAPPPIDAVRYDEHDAETIAGDGNAANDNAASVATETTLSELASEASSELSATVNALVVRKPMGTPIRLLFFFVLLTQVSDMLQYLASQVFRFGVIAPTINSTRTWPGIAVGVVSTGLVGLTLWFFTPYPFWWQAGVVAMAVSLMGFAGGITMSAIKRDRGVDDYGKLIEGHSGALDRIDSLCFAAPIFYHLTWLFTATS